MSRSAETPGPLAALVEGFAAFLAERGYARGSIRNHLHLLGEVDAWLAGEGLFGAGPTAESIERFCRQRPAKSSLPAVTPLLDYLDALGVLGAADRVVVSEVDRLVTDFGDYLLVERGLADGTVVIYQRAARLFLSGGGEPIGDWLRGLDGGDINAFVVAECGRRGVASAKSLIGGLRALLRFLYLNGWIPRPLVNAVPGVANRHGGSLPRGLDPGEVALLLGSCARDRAVGCRDFAILTVLARLGVRANEAACLELGDVDWRAGEVLVRGKGSRLDGLPLPDDVGEAIVDYLRRHRPPVSCRQLFLRSCAPFHGLSSSAVSAIVRAACTRAGVRSAGAHSLRHGVARELLRQGAPLVEIGQLLRHNNAATTAIYARVDRVALSTVALPWPGAAS